MPFSDLFSFETSLVTPPPPPPETANTFVFVAEPAAVPVGFASKIKLYSGTAEMDADGWTTAHAVYNAAAQAFAQEPAGRPEISTRISRIAVLRRETPVANVWQIDINSTTDGDHKVFYNGVLAGTFTAAASTATQIKDGLVAAVDAGPFAAEIDADTVDADSLSITGLEDGIPFVITVEVPGGTIHDVSETTPSVGIYQDLAAGYVQRPFWGVHPIGCSDAEASEAERWCAADQVSRRCFVYYQTADAAVYDSGDTDNLAYVWRVAQRSRGTIIHHPTPTEYEVAKAIGRMGGTVPGQRAWSLLPLAGSVETAITANRTADQTATMRERRIGYTERLRGELDDLSLIGRDPQIASGVYICQRWAEDAWWYLTRSIIYAELKRRDGYDFTNDDLTVLGEVVLAGSEPLVATGVVADIAVTFEPVENLPAGQVAIGDAKTPPAGLRVSATITPKLRALSVSAVFALA